MPFRASLGGYIHRDPSPRPKPQPLRALVLDPAEAPVIAAARRLLTETRPADARIELEAIPPVGAVYRAKSA